MTRIYLDWAASAPLAESAKLAMQSAMNLVGNPSSQHFDGRQARALLDNARAGMSERLGCEFGELVFTSGATEAAQLAIIGAALANKNAARTRVLMTQIEHHCVLAQAKMLQRLGLSVEYIPVNREGMADLDWIEQHLDGTVLLAAVMHANNEIGTWQPLNKIAELAHKNRTLVFADCAQTVCATDPYLGARWTLPRLDVDLASFSAHKWGGPKGVGALFMKAGTNLDAVLAGGGQEREMRAGTENVIGITGMAAALETWWELLDPRPENPSPDRNATSDLNARTLIPTSGKGDKAAASTSMPADVFTQSLDRTNLKMTVPDPDIRLGSIVHLRVPGVDSETMVIRLDQEGISIGSGAACSSGSLEPSHVLQSCGYNHQESKEGLRFSFGPTTTDFEAVTAAETLNRVAAEFIANKQKAPWKR